MSIAKAAAMQRAGRHTAVKTGTVVEIGKGYDDEQMYRVDIELPARKRKKTKGKARITSLVITSTCQRSSRRRFRSVIG
jgi:hypothetical protein